MQQQCGTGHVGGNREDAGPGSVRNTTRLRLVLSACYVETADWGRRALSCERCHDPHSSIEAPGARERVRAACSSCHADQSPEHSESIAQESAGACTLDDAERKLGKDCVEIEGSCDPKCVN